eukprot:6212144-Pleurochrysis_carterae.AAC.1
MGRGGRAPARGKWAENGVGEVGSFDECEVVAKKAIGGARQREWSWKRSEGKRKDREGRQKALAGTAIGASRRWARACASLDEHGISGGAWH